MLLHLCASMRCRMSIQSIRAWGACRAWGAHGARDRHVVVVLLGCGGIQIPGVAGVHGVPRLPGVPEVPAFIMTSYHHDLALVTTLLSS